MVESFARVLWPFSYLLSTIHNLHSLPSIRSKINNRKSSIVNRTLWRVVDGLAARHGSYFAA